VTGRRERLGDSEIEAALATLSWEREGESLVKRVRRAKFRDALAFVNRVGELAEQRDHHPDIDIRWNRVILRLSTHSAGGITAMDLELARAIDELE
jgi:4a-hydroxytetrahydrobiopterin dehydratase